MSRFSQSVEPSCGCHVERAMHVSPTSGRISLQPASACRRNLRLARASSCLNRGVQVTQQAHSTTERILIHPLSRVLCWQHPIEKKLLCGHLCAHMHSSIAKVRHFAWCVSCCDVALEHAASVLDTLS
eukprot:3097806-Rhodomonas_salina.1